MRFRVRIKVDLPQPEGPINAVIALGSITTAGRTKKKKSSGLAMPEKVPDGEQPNYEDVSKATSKVMNQLADIYPELGVEKDKVRISEDPLVNEALSEMQAAEETLLTMQEFENGLKSTFIIFSKNYSIHF